MVIRKTNMPPKKNVPDGPKPKQVIPISQPRRLRPATIVADHTVPDLNVSNLAPAFPYAFVGL